MKKSLLLLLVPFLFLYGCGGGGAGDVLTGDSGAPAGGSGSYTVADAGNLTITFPTVQSVQPLGLVSTIDPNTDLPYVRTDARLVVRKTETVDIATPVYIEECDPVDILDCSLVPTGEFTHDFVQQEVFKQIVDKGLVGGGGTVSMSVPPGVGYTLEVLTSVWEETEQINLMWEYAKSAPFDIVSGATTDVSITLTSELATLSLPTDPVESGASYDVSCTKSEALRDQWYVRQVVDETDLGDLSTSWFLRDTTDPGVSGTNSITLQGPVEAGPADYGNFVTSQWTVWHHGQFYINANLLNPGEDYRDWTFGTSAAGPLNPMGSINIVL